MKDLLIKVYKNNKLSSFLSVLSHIISALFIGVFIFTVGYEIYLSEYTEAAILATSCALGFIAVSLARAYINAPRPYELYDFYEVKPKEREGKSFPSRHAYSAAAISVISCAVCPWSVIPFAALTILMCVCRALLGIHFIRDLAAGVLIGALTGAIGLLLI